jgi:GGDEF domain-containing protein
LLYESLSKAHRFAYHDLLTGLPNRRLLADHDDISDPVTSPGWPFATL